MKAVLLTYNQTLTEKVDFMLSALNIKGYTQFSDVTGRGSNTGEPRLGIHAWPELNNAMIIVVEDDMVEKVFDVVQKIDSNNKSEGIRAFAWDILASV